LAIALVLMAIFNLFGNVKATQTAKWCTPNLCKMSKMVNIAKVQIDGRVLRATTQEGKNSILMRLPILGWSLICLKNNVIVEANQKKSNPCS
jgi:cell division protease FtsH